MLEFGYVQPMIGIKIAQLERLGQFLLLFEDVLNPLSAIRMAQAFALSTHYYVIYYKQTKSPL